MANLDTLIEIGEMGLGGLGVGYAQDGLLMPVVENLLPVLQSNTVIFKVADSLMTAGLGMLAGKFIKPFSRRFGERVEMGAFTYAGMKGFSLLAPGTEVKVTYPNIGNTLVRTGLIPSPSGQAPAVSGSAPAAQLPAGGQSSASGQQAAAPNVPSTYVFPSYGGFITPAANVGG